jgi:hypothetical protein
MDKAFPIPGCSSRDEGAFRPTSRLTGGRSPAIIKRKILYFKELYSFAINVFELTNP